MFSCEICKTFNNTYFEEHLRTTPSIHGIVSYSMLVSDNFLNYFPMTEMEVIFEGHDPEIRSFLRNLLMNKEENSFLYA